jgi:hypothetical protein
VLARRCLILRNKKVGRPKLCGLFRAVEIACTYLRRNGTQEFLGDLRGVSQSTMSRILAKLAPVVRSVLTEGVRAHRRGGYRAG